MFHVNVCMCHTLSPPSTTPPPPTTTSTSSPVNDDYDRPIRSGRGSSGWSPSWRRLCVRRPGGRPLASSCFEAHAVRPRSRPPRRSRPARAWRKLVGCSHVERSRGFIRHRPHVRRPGGRRQGSSCFRNTQSAAIVVGSRKELPGLSLSRACRDVPRGTSHGLTRQRPRVPKAYGRLQATSWYR
jgi:hypothetical protein